MRVSPINSPRRRREREEEEEEELPDTDSDESSSAPPPSYTSSHHSHASSKAYSSLMSFLDEASSSSPLLLLPPSSPSSSSAEKRSQKHRINREKYAKSYQERRRGEEEVRERDEKGRDERRRKENGEVFPIEVPQPSDEDMRDDISSMSYSMTASSLQGKAFTSNKYIWNELEEEENRSGNDRRLCSQHNSRDVPSSYASSSSSSRRDRDTSTYFSAPPSYLSSSQNKAKDGGGRRGKDDDDSSRTSSLQSNVEEVQEKAKSMQMELRRKNQRVKELQSEYARLNAAKNRKREKLNAKYSRELQSLREENHKSLLKQKLFVEKVQETVASLTKKSMELEEKLRGNDAALKRRVDAAKEDGAKSIRRAKKQWEADEKAALEKLASNKRESMQKAANDHISPKLEHLVKENREILLNKKEECDNEMVKRTAEYKSELQKEFEYAIQHLKERYAGDEGGHSSSRNRKIEEVRHRHEGEIRALKERFAEEQRMLQESSDRSRRLDTESHLASMEKLKEIERKAVEDWMIKQQREINSTLQKQEIELKRVEEEVNDMYSEWEERQAVQEEKVQNHRLEKIKGQMMLNAKKEMETIRQKIRAEALAEREAFSKKIDDDLKQLRLENQEKLQDKYEADKRSSDLVASLHSEVERLQDRLYHHRSTITDMRSVVEEEKRKSRLVAVENNIDGVTFEESSKKSQSEADFSVVEQAVISLKSRLDAELARTEADGNRSIREAAEALDKAHKQKAAMDMSHYHKITARKAELQEELSRVEEKISLLVSRKNKSIIDMKDTLHDLQTKNREFEQQLDEFRQKKMNYS